MSTVSVSPRQYALMTFVSILVGALTSVIVNYIATLFDVSSSITLGLTGMICSNVGCTVALIMLVRKNQGVR